MWAGRVLLLISVALCASASHAITNEDLEELFPMAGDGKLNLLAIVEPHLKYEDPAVLDSMFSRLPAFDIELLTHLELLHRRDPMAVDTMTPSGFKSRMIKFLLMHRPTRVQESLKKLPLVLWMRLRSVIGRSVADRVKASDMGLSECAVALLADYEPHELLSVIPTQVLLTHTVTRDCDAENGLPFDVVYALVGNQLSG